MKDWKTVSRLLLNTHVQILRTLWQRSSGKLIINILLSFKIKLLALKAYINMLHYFNTNYFGHIKLSYNILKNMNYVKTWLMACREAYFFFKKLAVMLKRLLIIGTCIFSGPWGPKIFTLWFILQLNYT